MENEAAGASRTTDQMTIGDAEKSEHKLTIGQAKKLYLKFGRDLFTDFEGYLKNVKRNKALANDNYLTALLYTDDMFDDTQSSLRMLYGGGDGFLDTLRRSFTSMLERMQEGAATAVRGARIILLGEQNPPILKELADDLSDVLRVERMVIPETSRVNHYMIGDDGGLRVEEVHPPLNDEMDYSAIKAKVYRDNKKKAKKFIVEFDDLWMRLSGEGLATEPGWEETPEWTAELLAAKEEVEDGSSGTIESPEGARAH